MSHDLVGGVLAGEPAAIARAITLVEAGGERARTLLRALRGQAGRAHIVGITGSAGVGKSSLINQLVRELRLRGRSVGVIAVDPTSPLSAGAILGDRVRMQQLASDPAVFVRSMATRGALGGLAKSTEGAATILDAAGKDIVVVETVGAGQCEVDIAAFAHSIVLVLAPAMGDSIQTLKAGILEVADIFVVNKADLDGADQTVADLTAVSVRGLDQWKPPILKTVALSGSGIPNLVSALEDHRQYLTKDGSGAVQKAELMQRRILALARSALLEAFQEQVDTYLLGHLTGLVLAGESDPYSAAEALLRQFLPPKASPANRA